MDCLTAFLLGYMLGTTNAQVPPSRKGQGQDALRLKEPSINTKMNFVDENEHHSDTAE